MGRNQGSMTVLCDELLHSFKYLTMHGNQKILLKYKSGIALIFFTIISVINTWVRSVSIVADHQKNNAPFSPWEPYSWEFTSLTMLFLLLPLIVLINNKFLLKYGRFKFNLMVHLFATVLFSVIHSVGMLAMRKAIYKFQGSVYDFGHWPSELFYEYRKDMMTYFVVIAFLYVYQLIVNQLQGVASLFTADENGDLTQRKVEKLLIKKKGREYIIDLTDVSTIEAGGNYVYIHANKQVYPMRETMLNILKKLDSKQFIRVHRSFIVNLEFIKEITLSESADYRIILTNKQSIPLSRKYRADLKKIFNI